MINPPSTSDLGPGSDAISCAMPNAGAAFAWAWLAERSRKEPENVEATKK